MKLKLYIIDAFADTLFSGNPAAVVPLQDWLSDALLQKIALENNQAETAFFVKQENNFKIRWFTPVIEVDLCGHATLASAHVLWNFLACRDQIISFESRSGVLQVTRENDLIKLDFPSDYYLETEYPDKLNKGLGFIPQEVYIGKTDYLCVVDYEEKVQRIKPDFALLAELKVRGIIVTAKGNQVDFVYRFFGPASGINEDQATGSAQTTLMPYWSKKLGKNTLTSVQLSSRVGNFISTIKENRVEICGRAQTYLIGEIHV